MLPLWIIDMGCSAASAKKLQDLLSETGESLKPYWHYYHVKDKDVSDTDSCKAFIDELVSDGRECYNAFIKEGYQVGNFQIVILGAADEKLSQQMFAPLAGLIRDNLPRIIADHANLGVEITCILFIPSTVNQLDDLQERTNVAMLLENLNMLNERLGARHFNRLVAYQDVQYKGHRFYPGLNVEQRTELLFQILTNLFFVSAKSERLFDKIGSGEGIYSLGAASVYYNSEQHHAYELKHLLDKLVAEFKNEENYSEDYANKLVHEVLREDVLNTDEISARFREECSSTDVDLKKMEGEADPHPVWDLFRSDLIPSYYHKFLKYMPARLMAFMQSLSYILLTRFSGILRDNRKKAVGKFIPLLHSIYRKVFLDPSANYATIAQVESVFKAAKEYLANKRESVKLVSHEIVPVPKYLRNDYDKCETAGESNKPSDILENIKKNLKKEPIVLSLIVRCFLLGILLVFTVIPVLRVLSPKVINLGEIATIEWLWIPVLFFLPLIIEFFIKLRRHFKRIKRLKYRLLAATLLSVNKRLSKSLMEEQGTFYDELIKECDAQLELLAKFRESMKVPEATAGKGVIPQTTFNQPLLGGSFCGEKLLGEDSVSEAEIRVKDEVLRLSDLKSEDLIGLLKNSFRQPETLDTIDLSDDKEPPVHAEAFVSVLSKLFAPELLIHTAENAGAMMSLLGQNVNVTPWEKMAAVNGMLFSVSSNNKPVLRITNVPRLLEGMNIINDEKTADYALLTYWQKIIPCIQSQLVCNCSLEQLPKLSFADKLSLYYGYYRQKDLAYSLAGTPVRIPKEEMDQLDKQLKEDRL